MSAEQKVREAAAALLLAISEATAAGLVVQWPSRLEGLAALAISETGQARVRRPGEYIRGAVEPDDEIEMRVVGKPEPVRIRGKRKRS